jgi:predicted AAA+ superfamily ATPase
MYIYRELQDYLYRKISTSNSAAFIISGVVGCGKTTMIQSLLADLQNEFEVFQFSGDDIQFRNAVANDSKYIAHQILSITQKKSFVFVDEVQKSESIFDALKYAFDTQKISFIVSGSNPAFLASVAKKRLQRRAEHLYMLPLSLPEILLAEQLIPPKYLSLFYKILWEGEDLKNLPHTQLTKNETLTKVVNRFLTYGGLPLAHLANDPQHKLTEIKLTVERGFDLFTIENNEASEIIKIELALLHSKEFTYQNIFSKTRTNRRDVVNNVINELINHDYLVRKRPLLLKAHKSSYLSVFSYIDPGIVTYLSADLGEQQEKGFRIEGYIHARLDHFVKNATLKCGLGYFKPHTIDKNKKTKYTPGEIDFVFEKGKKLVPIEVKATDNLGQIDLTQIILFLKEHKTAQYGIVLYGGVPYVDLKNRILFWPYWLV